MTVITHFLFAKSLDNIAGRKEKPPDLNVFLSNYFVRTGIGVSLLQDKKPLAYFRMIFEVGERLWVNWRKERFPAERKSEQMQRIDDSFKITRRMNDNIYQLTLQGKHYVSPSFNVTDLVHLIADELDLRSNPFQVGEDDMILDGTRSLECVKELEPEDELEPEEQQVWIQYNQDNKYGGKACQTTLVLIQAKMISTNGKSDSVVLFFPCQVLSHWVFLTRFLTRLPFHFIIAHVLTQKPKAFLSTPFRGQGSKKEGK